MEIMFFVNWLLAASIHSWLKVDDMDQEISEANWHPECSVLVRDLKVRVYVKKHDGLDAMWQPITPMSLNNYDMTIGLLIPAETHRRQRVNQWQMVMFGFPKRYPL